MKLTRLLSVKEFHQMGDDAVARGLYRNDRSVFTPGMGWYQPWYWVPPGWTGCHAGHVMIKERPKDYNESKFLSPHFWRDWADKRPPLCIVGPNGETWEVDRRSSNGDGWSVSGEWPHVTCSPSIVLNGYHGFLRDGEFTPDLEGRN